MTLAVGCINWSVALYTQVLGSIHALKTVKVCNLIEGFLS